MERAVMDGQQEFGPCLVRHPKRLFGGAVGAQPRIVCAHGHDREVDSSRGSKTVERMGQSGIAAEKDAMARRLDQIAVEPAISVGTQARAPVAHFKSSDTDIPDAHRLVPR